MIKLIEETTDYLKEKGFESPEIGIILGTGLGQLINHVEIIKEVSYNHIPNFPTATVEFHKGKLIYGMLEGKKVIVMQGRFHLYEGYTLQDVTYPVRIMKQLGVSTLLVSNASGALNLDYNKGDLMLIEDHINLQGGSPLAFKGVEQLGAYCAQARYTSLDDRRGQEPDMPLIARCAVMSMVLASLHGLGTIQVILTYSAKANL